MYFYDYNEIESNRFGYNERENKCGNSSAFINTCDKSHRIQEGHGK